MILKFQKYFDQKDTLDTLKYKNKKIIFLIEYLMILFFQFLIILE